MSMFNKTNKSFLTLILITLLIITFALGMYFWNFHSYGLSNETADWASFGAYVGGILGTCFAFATFWMLFSTFRLQQKQSENTEVQKFETTFYSLLELHNQKLRELDLDPVKLARLFDNDPLIGQELAMSDDDFKKVSDPSAFQSKEGEYETTTTYLKELQREILEDIQLSQYFRVLYQLLKYIARNNIKNFDHNFDAKYLSDQSNLSIEYEKMYSSITRGFVPVPLLPILALNCIYTPEGLKNLDKFQALLERYGFLEHTRFDLLPKNLAHFLILNNYDYAIGINKQVENIARKILEKYENIELNKNAYLFKLSLIENTKVSPLLKKTLKQRIDYHFEIMKKDFYDDKHTIHEPILFLLSNTGASVFYLTIFSYLFQNYSDISNQQPFYIVCITIIAMCLSFLTSVYLFTITGGRLAITLGKKEVSDNMTILIILSIVLSMFVTMFMGILMAAPTTIAEKKPQTQSQPSTSVNNS